VPVVALVGNKGGAGKTTLAMNLAAGLGRREGCLVVDADPQGSASQWARVASANDRSSVQVMSAGDDLTGQIGTARRQYPSVVIDCPPSIDAVPSQQALLLSDLVIAPILPSPLDLWATTRIAAAVDQARLRNPRLRARLVVNQFEPRTTLSRIVGGALDELELKALSARIRRRSIYRNCMIEGRTVYDVGARGRAAVEEIEQLLAEIR
jgi:chromosome partitioning protein